MTGSTVSTNTRQDGPVRLHALDGLRALAASLVIAHHLGAPRVAEALVARGHARLGFVADTVGASGVELFFVLSGVVLARPYLRNGRRIEVSTYFRRRVARLFPPYFVAWLLAGFCVNLTSLHPTWYTSTAQLPRFRMLDWLSQLGIVSFGVHYNFAWWSLTVEVLFYVLLPALLGPLSRLDGSARTSLILMGSIILGSLVPGVLAPGLERVLPEGIAKLITYSPCFAAGLLLARADFPRAMALGFAGLGVLVLLAASIRPVVSHIGYALLYAGIVARALDYKAWLSSMLGQRLLVWVGERSYSLFLVHHSIIVLVYLGISMIIASSGWRFVLVSRLAAVPLSLITAMLLFSYVERRFARGLVTGDSFWPWGPRDEGGKGAPAVAPVGQCRPE